MKAKRKPILRPADLWCALILVGTAYEFWALRGRRREATLSHLTRKVFATHTVAGRGVFVIFWAALSAWFPRHILDEGNGRV